jgi:hypothetical protein
MGADSIAVPAASGDPARALVQLVNAAQRVLASIRAAECALVGASAGCVTVAAAVLSGDEGASSGVRALAALVASLAALMWWLERRPETGAAARRIDRAEGRSGELVTAFELATRGASAARKSEIADLLAARASSRLSMRRCMRAVLPSSIALLALPCAALAVLALSVEATHDEGPERAIESAAGSLAAEARHVRAAAARSAARGAGGADTAAKLQALAEDAERGRRELLARSAAPSAPPGIDAQLGAHEARLNELARESTDRSVASELEAAQRSIRSARDALAAAGRKEASHTTETDVSAGTGATRTGASGAGSASSPPTTAGHAMQERSPTPDSGARIAASGETHASKPERRASELDNSTRTSEHGPVSTEHGLDAGRWWPARYDAVVERWVESRRDAHATPSHDR